MSIAVICGKCGKVHTLNDGGADLVVDFRQKYISFICQNKECRHDNVFSFEDWKEVSKASPLPSIRIV